MRQPKIDLELCEKAKITCNKDDGVRYSELAKYWIKRAVEAEELLKEFKELHRKEGIVCIKKWVTKVEDFLRGGEK